MIGHAVANQVGVIASNRAGVEGAAGAPGGAITFHGSSFVCDHRGDKLAELDRTEAGVAVATFDLDRLQPGAGVDGLLPRPPARAVRAAGEVARRARWASHDGMQLFVRAVVTGFALSLGAALFKKVSKQLGLDDKPAKEAAASAGAAEAAPSGS
jgi:hypothetical protein